MAHRRSTECECSGVPKERSIHKIQWIKLDASVFGQRIQHSAHDMDVGLSLNLIEIQEKALNMHVLMVVVRKINLRSMVGTGSVNSIAPEL